MVVTISLESDEIYDLSPERGSAVHDHYIFHTLSDFPKNTRADLRERYPLTQYRETKLLNSSNWEKLTETVWGGGRGEADPVGSNDLLLTVPRDPNLVSQANHPRINLIY